MTTSAPATAAGALSDTTTPLSAAAAVAAGIGSKPRTVWPASTRFFDIGPPMWPSPKNATVDMCSGPLLGAGADPGGLGSSDDHPHDFIGALQNAVHPEVAHDL